MRPLPKSGSATGALRRWKKKGTVVDLLPLRVAHDHGAEEAAIDVGDEVHAVVVERPGADRVLRRVEDVAPFLAGADLVAARSSWLMTPKGQEPSESMPVLEPCMCRLWGTSSQLRTWMNRRSPGSE